MKKILNSLFLQINPDFDSRKNVYFMNYYSTTQPGKFNILGKYFEKKETKTGFSRTEDYFLYKGVNRSPYSSNNNSNYATIYIRADNKKMEIKKEYQNFLDFNAEISSFCLGIFAFLNILFSFYNGYHSTRSMSKKLFFFEENENNKYIILKRRNSLNTTDSSIPKVDLNDITMNDMKDKDKNKKNKDFNSMPIIFTQKKINNFIASSSDKFEKRSSRGEINYIRTKTKEEREQEEKKNKNPFSILDIIKISIFTCSKLSYKENLIKQAMDIFDKKLNIYIYIKNMILLDIMYQILMDEINKDCVNFISRSFIYSYRKKNEEEKELKQFYLPTSKLKSEISDLLFGQLQKLMDKNEKTEIEKKIISLYTDK